MKKKDVYFPELKSTVKLDISKISDKENIVNLTFYFRNEGWIDIYIEDVLIGHGTLEYNEYTVVEINDPYKDFEDEITQLFDKYYCFVSIRIGYPVDLKSENLEETYLSLLLQALIANGIKTLHGVDYAYRKYEQAADWLLNSGDFFTAPASTRFHDNKEGGLLYHTLKVYNYMCDLKKTDTFWKVDVGDMTLSALVHDWCKINVYKSYMKNVKDEATGQWVQELAYRYTEPKFPFGHGETSMYLANKFFYMSLEASLAVRWHMDKYYTDDALNNDLYTARAKYPLVIMLQTADKLSLVEY